MKPSNTPPDEYFQCEPCYFNDDFTLVVQEQNQSDEIAEQCPHQAIVRNVIYSTCRKRTLNNLKS